MKKILMLFLSLFVLAGMGVPVDACNTGNTWVPNPDFNITGSTISWGGGGCSGCFDGKYSKLTFEKLEYDAITSGTAFELGELTFYNAKNEGADSDLVGLIISFDGTTMNGVPLDIDFTVNLRLDETLNTGADSADAITLLGPVGQPFELNSDKYAFSILGFGDDFGSTLSAAECGSNSAILYAQIDAVPVPASIVLLGSGLLSLIGISRRRS